MLGGAEVGVANAFDTSEHLLHLVAGVGVVDLEVFEIVEEALNLPIEAFGGVGDPTADLSLDGLSVLNFLPTSGIEFPDPIERSDRLLNRREGLVLHGQGPSNLFADCSPLIVQKGGDLLGFEDAKLQLPALAQLRTSDRVEVGRGGVEGQNRAGLQVAKRRG